MKSEKNFNISFEELARRGQQVLAQRSEVSLSQALEQIRLLKANSKVGQSSKKSRTDSINIHQYNAEIHKAMERMDAGEFYTHDQVKEMSKDWLNGKEAT